MVCIKHNYSSIKIASKAAMAMQKKSGGAWDAYACGDHFHIGHAPGRNPRFKVKKIRRFTDSVNMIKIRKEYVGI